MPVLTQAQSAKGAALLSLGALASATYLGSAVVDLTAAIPLDVTVEVECTPSAATSGNKQLVVFAQFSLDGTNFSTGPTSGTATTNEPDLYYLGVVPCNDNTLHRKQFSIESLPTARYMKVVVKNDMGVALTSGNVYIVNITGVST